MIVFDDGPAAGVSLQLRRAPLFLRVVIDKQTGEVDALDQLGDQPRLGETIHAYRRVTNELQYHMRACKDGSGWYSSARYQLHDEQPADHVGRDRESWREWTQYQWEKENAI